MTSTSSAASTTTRSSPRCAPATRRTSSARSTPTTSASTAHPAAGSTSGRISSTTTSTCQFPPARATTRRTRASAARCRCSPTLRPLLQQDPVQAGGHQGAAEDLLGARRRREEAHEEELRRHVQGARLRPERRLLRNTPDAGSRRTARKWLDAQGQVEPRPRSGLDELLTWQKQLIDYYGYNNLVNWQAGPATSSRRRTRSRTASSR